MKIAFVLPWFGQFCFGGAEQEAKNTALNLQKTGFEVEILATCVQNSHANWNQNYYPAGQSQEAGLLVRRFPIRPADHFKLNKILGRLRSGLPLAPEEEEIFAEQNIRSLALNNFIRENAQNYDFFIFIPYLYGPAIDGSQIVPEKSLLIPCLHNENFARMGIFKKIFNQFRFVIFHTDAEKKLAEELYQIDPAKSQVLGEGVNTEIKFESGRFKKKYQLSSPYLLWVGRKDEGKNISLLLNYFESFKKIIDGDLKLILMGAGQALKDNFSKDILELGYLPDEEKYGAYADAFLTIQPSLNESFSLVLMESWLAETPVLVNGFCEVTREHCLKSQAGLYFENFWQFAEAVNWFLKNPEKGLEMGRNGRQYVLENFSWDKIIPRYQQLLKSLK